MTRLKKTLIISITLLLTATLPLWILSRAINPNILRDYVNGQLTTLTSQPSRINGTIQWQLLPHPAMKITNILIGDADKKTDYTLRLDTMLFNLKIAPLFRGKIVFNEITVDGFRLRINARPSTDKTAVSRNKKLADNLNEQFAVERFLFSHGNLTFVQNEQQIQLKDLQIGAENINLQTNSFPFQLKSSLEYANNQNLIAKALIQFRGRTVLSKTLIRDQALDLKSPLVFGQLIIQNANLGQLKISKLNANTSFKQGVLQLNPLTINLYQGQSIGDLRYDVADNSLQINQTASGLNSNKLTLDLFDKSLLKGKLDMSLHAQTDLSKGSWSETSRGNGNISIRDGSLELVDLNKIIKLTCHKINNLSLIGQPGMKHSLSDETEDDQSMSKGSTPFKLLSIPYHLESANLHSDAMLLQTDNLQLKGDAHLAMSNYALDGHLQATVSVKDKKVNDIQGMLGGYFPLLIKNSLLSPLVLPDLNKINPILTKAWINNTLTKPVKSLSDRVMTMLP